MSYIEQDALLERIDGIYDCNDMRFEPNDKCCTVPDDCKGCKWAETKRAIRKIVENMPSADVRPVVLCKDCKYRTQVGNCAHPRIVGVLPTAYPMDFCSYGEKKEET